MLIPELDMKAKKEDAHYKAVTTRSRFLQQIFLGLGGATVFGFIGALTRELMAPATKALAGSALMTPTASVLGMAGIAILGIACLYIGAKYLSNTILMEQEYSAKKIALASGRGRAQVKTPTVETEHTKPASPPISVGVAEVSEHQAHAAPAHSADTPTTHINDVAFHQPLEATTRVRA